MIRAIALLSRTLFATTAHADHHKGDGKPGKGNQEISGEVRASERIPEAAMEEGDDERTPEERAAHKAAMIEKKDATKAEAMARKEGAAESAQVAPGKGREMAMEKRNSEQSQREEALAETKAKPWWKFWE